jgi:hypothetical protein
MLDLSRRLSRTRLILFSCDVGHATDTTIKMIYCNTLDPLLVSAGNSSRYQYW